MFTPRCNSFIPFMIVIHLSANELKRGLLSIMFIRHWEMVLVVNQTIIARHFSWTTFVINSLSRAEGCWDTLTLSLAMDTLTVCGCGGVLLLTMSGNLGWIIICRSHPIFVNSLCIKIWNFFSVFNFFFCVCVCVWVCICRKTRTLFRHPIFRSWTHHQTWTSADWGDSANGC